MKHKEVIDKTRILEAPERVRSIYKRFANALPGEIDLLSLACKARDKERVLNICHRLKGTSASCGFSELAASFNKLEDIVRAEKKNGVWLKGKNRIEELASLSIAEFDSLK